MSEPVSPQIKRNVGLLAGCQALLLCNAVTLIAVNGLAGAKLAPTPTLATLTVTGYVIGTALMTLPASWFMKHYGRRAGFIAGALLGILGGITCATAVSIGSFWLLCLGTLCAGTYNAFGLQYRFAAADMAPTDWKPKAISWTLAGGILGGFIGPWAGKITRDIWHVEFAATYASLSVFAVVALLIASRLRVPEMTDAGQQGSGRPLPEIARQPAFVVAVLAAALGYGTMNLLSNRIVIAPMCQYSAVDGVVGDWHRMHLGQLAISGAGLLIVEATAVEREGRITNGCVALHDDARKRRWPRWWAMRMQSPIKLAIQLGHAGRKASSQAPWDGGQHLRPTSPAAGWRWHRRRWRMPRTKWRPWRWTTPAWCACAGPSSTRRCVRCAPASTASNCMPRMATCCTSSCRRSATSAATPTAAAWTSACASRWRCSRRCVPPCRPRCRCGCACRPPTGSTAAGTWTAPSPSATR
jgi:MFS family permease